jgi:DNA-binding LacI/PurR family transcriptional regulator
MRSFACERRGLLGLIVPKASDPFILELIHSFENSAFSFGYGVLINSVGPEPARISLCIRRMIERNAEGLAVMIFDEYPLVVEELRRCAVPHVCIDHGDDSPPGHRLRFDHFDGIRQCVQHLTVLGHRKIGIVLESGQLLSTQSAIAAFSRSLGECGIVPDGSWIAWCSESNESIDQAAKMILACDDPPTAVICSGDLGAIAILQAASKFGLRIPEDLSVVGLGCHLPAIRPTLTSALISPSEIAQAALDAIRADSPRLASSRKIAIRPKLVIRDSTGFPRGAMMDLQLRKTLRQRLAL